MRLARANLERIGSPASVRLLARDATRLGPAPHPFDLAFLDPPYRSGLAGVSYHSEVIETGHGPVERRFWIARLPLEPWRTKLVKFSVAKYGAEEAFRRAVKARQDALDGLSGTFSPNSPLAQQAVRR